MPAVNLQYKISPDVSSYVSYTRGFKAGGFSAATPDVFDPELVDAYEVGLKGLFFDRALSLNVAAFLSNYSALQESTTVVLPNGATLQVIANSAKLRAKGVEFNGNLKVAPGLGINADVAYLSSRYVNYKNGACTTLALSLNPACVQDLSSNRRGYAPSWSGSVGLNVTQPVGTLDLRVEPIVAFTSGYYQQNFSDKLY